MHFYLKCWFSDVSSAHGHLRHVFIHKTMPNFSELEVLEKLLGNTLIALDPVENSILG